MIDSYEKQYEKLKERVLDGVMSYWSDSGLKNGDLSELDDILSNGLKWADHDCTFDYDCIDCDYRCGAGSHHAYLDPEERQELLWEVLQKIIGEVRWCSGFEFEDCDHGEKREPFGNWMWYDDSYSELLKEFLWYHGEEIKTYPRCSGLVNDLMKLGLFPYSENWGTLNLEVLGEYKDLADFWDSHKLSPPGQACSRCGLLVSPEEMAAGAVMGTPEDSRTPCRSCPLDWVEWHREMVLQSSMKKVISFCLKLVSALSLDVDREPSTALVFTRARRFLEICSEEEEQKRIAEEQEQEQKMAVLRRKEAFISAWDRGNRCWVVKNGVYRFVDHDRIRTVVNKLPPTAWSVDDYGSYEIK